jgi:hypothetical protein
MFNVENVAIISSACICNGQEGRLLFGRPGRDSKKQGGTVYTLLDSKLLSPVTILGNEIPWKAFNYWVHYHQIQLRLNSAFIFPVTATSEGLFAPLEGSLCLLGAIRIVLHLFLAEYFEPSIVCIFTFQMEIPLRQSQKHRIANNDVFSILWHQLCVLFPLLGIRSHVGGLPSPDDLGTTQFDSQYTRSVQYKRYVTQTQRLAL